MAEISVVEGIVGIGGSERPTMEMRWSIAGKLQQAFEIVEYYNGCPAKLHIEWRDVPTEQPGG